MMTRGAPDLHPGGNTVWAGGSVTPSLRWYNGSPTPYRFYVRPFQSGDQTITVEWWNISDVWVDFVYTGTERGTASQPYNTFQEGVDAVGHGGTLRVRAGQSGESGRVTKRVRVRAVGGPVTIGGP